MLGVLILGVNSNDVCYLYVYNKLKYLGFNVFFYPFFDSKMNKKDKEYHNSISDIIIKNNINYCLWWLPLGYIEYYDMDKINQKCTSVKHLYYNFDYFVNNDSSYWQYYRSHLSFMCKYFNDFLTVNYDEVDFLNALKYNKSLLVGQGYDPNVFYKQINTDYKCDISFVIHQLYTEDSMWKPSSNFLTRVKLLDLLYSDTSIDLKIYGPEYLAKRYPRCYQRYLQEKDTALVFSNSKINVSLIAVDKIYGYSKRVSEIIGCEGVILSNNCIDPYLTPNDDFIYIKDYDSSILTYIKNMLNDDNKLNKMRENIKSKKHLFTWDYTLIRHLVNIFI